MRGLSFNEKETMKIEERKKYLDKKQTLVLENIAPSELEFVRHIVQEQYRPGHDILPTVFDFYRKVQGADDELVCSYVMLETKTRKILKPVKGKTRLQYLNDQKEKEADKKKPVRKSVGK